MQLQQWVTRPSPVAGYAALQQVLLQRRQLLEATEFSCSCLPFHLHPSHTALRGSLVQPCQQLLQVMFVALCCHFHTTITPVAHPSHQLQGQGFFSGAGSEEDTLNTACGSTSANQSALERWSGFQSGASLCMIDDWKKRKSMMNTTICFVGDEPCIRLKSDVKMVCELVRESGFLESSATLGPY